MTTPTNAAAKKATGMAVQPADGRDVGPDVGRAPRISFEVPQDLQAAVAKQQAADVADLRIGVLDGQPGQMFGHQRIGLLAGTVQVSTRAD